LGKLVLFKNKRDTGLTLIFSLDIAASTAVRSMVDQQNQPQERRLTNTSGQGETGVERKISRTDEGEQ